MSRIKPHLKAFVAGFAATLVFHQGLLLLLAAAGMFASSAFDTAATWPLGVPKFVSLAFWGGVWGVLLWGVVRRRRGSQRWLWALVFGAVAPTLIALAVVFPLKGIAIGPLTPVLGAVLNGVWGLGTLLILQGLRRVVPD